MDDVRQQGGDKRVAECHQRTEPKRRLLADQRGAIMAEYVILLGTVSILAAAAIVGLGPHLIANYERSQGILLSPFP